MESRGARARRIHQGFFKPTKIDEAPRIEISELSKMPFLEEVGVEGVHGWLWFPGIYMVNRGGDTGKTEVIRNPHMIKRT